MGDILVSFLLPTRNRVPRLIQSLDSLTRTATRPVEFEVLVRGDDDDHETQNFIDRRTHVRNPGVEAVGVAPRPEAPITKWEFGPRGRGYLDLHLMYNALSKHAEGEFLFLWNDDALMLTPGWDDVLRGHLADAPKVYKPSSPGHQRNIFPIVRRSVYEAMGRFSESALNDFYMSTVAKRAGIEAEVAISVQHDHPFQGGVNFDQMYLDAVAACSVCKHDDKDPFIIKCIDEDVAKVKLLLSR